MRVCQHKEFAALLDELKFYKNWDDNIETYNSIVSFKHAITYWGIVCCLFDHMVSYAEYLDSVAIGDEPPHKITLLHINGIINDYTKGMYK